MDINNIRILASQFKPLGRVFRHLARGDSPKHFSMTVSETEKALPIASTEPETDVFAQSLKDPDFFNVSELFTMEDLFSNKVHLGHMEGSLNDFMRPYIFGSRLGHTVFDLDQTAALLRQALNFTAHVAFRGGIILFISRGAQHQLLVEKTAKSVGEYAHNRAWAQSTFTDSTNHFGSVTRLPDLGLFLTTHSDVMTEHEAVRDCARMLIPTTGIVDSNSDPRLITYPVPGNDDSPQSVSLYCRLYSAAIMRGKEKRKEVLNNKK